MDDHTVWTTAALQQLAPAVIAAMWRLQPPPTLPTGASSVAGRYLDGSVSVDIEGGSALVLRLGPQSPPLNLTLLAEGSTPSRLAYRAAPVHATQACRWLDDGPDLEIAYFDILAAGANASALHFMSAQYERFG